MKKRNLRLMLLSFSIVVLASYFFAHGDSTNQENINNISDSLYAIQKVSLQKFDSIINEQNKIIEKFKSLQIDLTAKEVYEKSRSYLLWYFGFIGIILFLAGVIGYKTIIDYVRKQLEKKMVKEGTQIIKKETEKQVDIFIRANTEISQIEERIEKKLNEQLQKNQNEFEQIAKKNIEEYESAVKQLKESAAALQAPLIKRSKKGKVELKNEIPDRIDYSLKMTKIKNGGELGASPGLAMADCMEYYLMKQLNKKIVLSALFIYYYARKIGGTKGDSGAHIKDAVKAAQTKGVVSEKIWPYKIFRFDIEPPKKVENSEHYFVIDAAPVKNSQQITDALINYGPVIIGISVYDSFNDDGIENGIIKMPGPRENIIGGHGICITGFDEKEKLFKFRNSWGIEWGDEGHGYLPYDYIEKFSDDGWVIKKVSESPGSK